MPAKETQRHRQTNEPTNQRALHEPPLHPATTDDDDNESPTTCHINTDSAIVGGVQLHWFGGSPWNSTNGGNTFSRPTRADTTNTIIIHRTPTTTAYAATVTTSCHLFARRRVGWWKKIHGRRGRTCPAHVRRYHVFLDLSNGVSSHYPPWRQVNEFGVPVLFRSLFQQAQAMFPTALTYTPTPMAISCRNHTFSVPSMRPWNGSIVL